MDIAPRTAVVDICLSNQPEISGIVQFLRDSDHRRESQCHLCADSACLWGDGLSPSTHPPIAPSPP